jgi:hypothetical protein
MKKGLAAAFFVTAFAHSVLPASAYTQLFAFAGAQGGQTDANPNLLGGTTTPNPTRMFDLDAQVTAYHNAHPNPVPGALYTLDIGADDIFAALTTFPTDPSEITTEFY